MTAASITTTQTTIDSTSTSSSARKRRREILTLLRNKSNVDHDSSSTDLSTSTIRPTKKPCVEDMSTVVVSNSFLISTTTTADDAAPTTETSLPARKVSDAQTSTIATPPTTSSSLFTEEELTKQQDSSNTKKPQMRYDPDVPMSKDQAAAWRREQRRKRNRESAAASRQRQRDRISELEDEVEQWKIKFEEACQRLKKLEALQSTSENNCVPTNGGWDLKSPQLVVPGMAVSPCSSSHTLSPRAHSERCDVSECESFDPEGSSSSCSRATLMDREETHLNEKISRPA